MSLGYSTLALRASEVARFNGTMNQRDEAIKEEFYALHLRGQGRLDEAIELYRKRLTIEPLDARTRAQLAVTLWQNGDAAEALSEARTAVESEPDNYALRTILVRLLLENRQWSQALAEGKELLRMGPDQLSSHVLAGDAYHGMGDLNAAIRSYEVAAGLGVRHPDTFDGLGRLYEEAGRLDDAIDVYGRLLEFAPGFRIWGDSTLEKLWPHPAGWSRLDTNGSGSWTGETWKGGIGVYLNLSLTKQPPWRASTWSSTANLSFSSAGQRAAWPWGIAPLGFPQNRTCPLGQTARHVYVFDMVYSS